MITINIAAIPLTHDYVFKAIAKNCPEFLYNLISLITGIDLETVKMGEFIDTTYIKSTSQYCETDLTFKVNENLIIDFEVCRYYRKYILTKETNYAAEIYRLFCRDNKGNYKENFQVLQVVLCHDVNVGDFLYQEDYLYNHKYFNKEFKPIRRVTYSLDNVTNCKYNKDVSKELFEYLVFLSTKDRDKLSKLASNNPILRKVVDFMLTFDADKGVIVRNYEEEYNSIISSERFYAREEGIEQGREQGIEQGREEGRELGFEQGREQTIKSSILNMKNSGLDNNTIIKFLNTDEATINRALAK